MSLSLTRNFFQRNDDEGVLIPDVFFLMFFVLYILC
jgi:hypothetical protein